MAIPRLGGKGVTMNSLDLLGYVAAFLTTASFIPQAALVLRTRQTEGISLLMYSMFTFGVFLWMIYGIFIQAYPVAIANALTLTMSSLILFVAVQEKQKRRQSGL